MPPSAPEPDGFLEVGRVVKAHGLAGEVVVELWGDARRLEPGSSLRSDAGALGVIASRPHQDRHLVRFEGVDERSAAERLRGLVLRAEPLDVPEVPDDVLWVHQLCGAEVVTVEGRPLGTVVAVDANPASDLMVLDGGGLVPLRFVTEVQPGQRVVVDAPEGLVD